MNAPETPHPRTQAPPAYPDRHDDAVWADWCTEEGDLTICGTRMVEHSRDPIGVRWCFRHRKREPFYWVVSVPDGLSYYGPSGAVEGPTSECTDLFPGWSREWADE